MHPEIKKNFEEKLRLTVSEIVGGLDLDIKAMLAKHSAEGMLRSGNTIKKTMDLIADGNEKIYVTILEHLKSIDIAYYPEIESDIQNIANTAQDAFKKEALQKFKKNTEIAGNPQLYERMLPEIESAIATELAKFQNKLNATAVQLKLNTSVSPKEKFLWGIEVIILLVSMFIAGMWYKDQNGNYEPILIGLGLAFSLLVLVLKFGGKK